MRSRWHETIRCGSGASRCWRSIGLAGETEALDHYVELRRRLDDELGLEPSAELRQLQRRILEQDPELDASVPLVDARAYCPCRRTRWSDASAIWRRWPSSSHVATHDCSSSPARRERQDAPRARGRPAGGLELRQRRCDRRARAPARPRLAATDDRERSRGRGGAQPDSARHARCGSEQPGALVVLDNVEHLRSATPSFVELLARALDSCSWSRAVPCCTSPASTSSGLSARRRRRRRALRTACSGVAIRLRGHGRERGRGARDLQARRRPAARDRARSRLDQVADPESLARAARAEADRSDRRPSRPTGAPADAPRGDRLECGAADRRRTNGARPAVGAPAGATSRSRPRKRSAKPASTCSRR